MPIASANPFPSMLYVEGTTPASPSSGQQRLFVRSSDHVLCMVNSSGTVTALSGSLTNPMDGAGQIIYGGAAGAPTKLAAGTASQALVGGSTPAWSSVVGILQSAVATRTAGNNATTSTSFVDVTGLTVTLTTGARRCLVMLSGAIDSSGSSIAAVDVLVDGSSIGGSDGVAYSSGSNKLLAFFGMTAVLSAASHTIKIQYKSLTAGTTTIYGSSAMPSILTVLETGLTS